MAEESEYPELGATGAEAIGAPGVDPVAVALALAGASREKADRFLDQQSGLIGDQRHYVRERYKQLVDQVVETRLRVWALRLGVLLRLATAAVGIAIAAAIVLMVWDASRSKGLLIEPFSVPPDMAARGLTGQVMASQMLDKLTDMQNGTESGRPPQTYANNWGDDIKVEIPETGISVGDFRRFLRGWLGHDTHIDGEVWRTTTGIAITARSSGDNGATFTGAESELDTLMQKAAEHVYGITQPYRYANYLDRATFRPGAVLRLDEAEAIYKRLIYDPNPVERAWAWNGLGTLTVLGRGNGRQALRYYRKAVAVQPDFAFAYAGIMRGEAGFGHAEAALTAAMTRRRMLISTSSDTGDVDFVIGNSLGDFAGVGRLCRDGVELPNGHGVIIHDVFQDCVALTLAQQHEAEAARAWWREMPPLESPTNNGPHAMTRLQMDAALEDWQAVAAAEPSVEKTYLTFDNTRDLDVIFHRSLRPLLALAKAKLGDQAGAETLIAATPGDCYDCVRIRGLIAAAAKQGGRADYWFSRAVSAAPSIPFAYADWGAALLAHGDTDGAIAKFTIANQKGPHFADPLEMWGEALMAQRHPDGALAKFKEADKYAPNWGRLHLKWGEALASDGKPDAAKQQLAIAATLELAPADKFELARAPTRRD